MAKDKIEISGETLTKVAEWAGQTTIRQTVGQVEVLNKHLLDAWSLKQIDDGIGQCFGWNIIRISKSLDMVNLDRPMTLISLTNSTCKISGKPVPFGEDVTTETGKKIHLEGKGEFIFVEQS